MATRRSIHVVDGLLVPDFVTQERLLELSNFKLLEDDVFVVTYPKCGTTWTQQILKLIANKGQQDDTAVNNSVPWLENSLLSLECEHAIKPRGIKSHMPYNKFPYGNPQDLPCKFIHVIRNPKDVVTSFYYHVRTAFDPNIEKEDFFSKFMRGDVLFGNYFDHVLSWWEHKDNDNVLIMKYEDMKKDLFKSICKISDFVGANISEEVIVEIADQTEFTNMKNNPLANGNWRPELNSETDFLRKGIVGDWKNFLTSEQSAQIDDMCARRLDPVGLTFEC